MAVEIGLLKKGTIKARPRHLRAKAARRRDLRRLISNGLPDLADEDVMRAAWQRPRSKQQ